MTTRIRPTIAALIFAAAVLVIVPAHSAFAETDAEADAGLRADSRAALASLYSQTPAAKSLGESAKAILVFPNVVKAGFIVGAQYGNGVLLRGGKTTGYYNTVQGSVGYQAGVEKFGYALFLMTDSAIKFLNDSHGWELGVGPEIVIVDQGAAAQLSTTTAKKDVYAFYFDQKGLMGGVSIQGTKVTHLDK